MKCFNNIKNGTRFFFEFVIVVLAIGFFAGFNIVKVSENYSLSIVFISIFFVCIVTPIFVLLLKLKIGRPLRQVNNMILEMSRGNYAMKLNLNRSDEIGQIANSLDQISEDMEFIVIKTINRILIGDLDINIEPRSSNDILVSILKETIEMLRNLSTESEMLSVAATESKWEARGKANDYKGVYKGIIEGINVIMNTVANNKGLYETIFNAVPMPLHVLDNNKKWLLMNKSFEAIMVENDTIKDRISALGTDSYCFDVKYIPENKLDVNKQIEYTEATGYLNFRDRNYKVEKNYLKNPENQNVGCVEVFTDFTEILRVSKYTNGEIVRLGQNLMALSQGNTDFDLSVGEADEHTKEICSHFSEIQNSLTTVKLSMDRLIEDVVLLAQAGIEGRLDTRVDASCHQGNFSKIVEGINATLDAVVAPVQEASNTLGQLSLGNLNAEMIGHYNGDYARIKDNMNETIAFLKTYVAEISSTLNEIGHGNLNIKIDRDYLGDFQSIKTALNNITDDLSNVMAHISNVANQVEAGSNQIADGSQALAQGTTEQACAIQELTTSINEVSSETIKNAKFANEANALANEVKSKVELGNLQMNQMVSAMSEINEASNNISKIIKVIDDIAFQTNILSLNAAVEAARAGVHGKGFAVVAEEVRTLAARSAEAAKETTALIEGSINKTAVGSIIADDTATSLQEMLAQIGKVTGLVSRIAQASNRQASEISQINLGIEQVSCVVQTNSATAEESAAASEELTGQAEILRQMIEEFQLKN